MPIVPDSYTTILNPNDRGFVNWPLTYGVGTGSTEPTPRMTPDLFPPGYRQWTTGRFDDLENGIRGGGDGFRIEQSDPATYELSGQFFEHILLVGGTVVYKNGTVLDEFTFQAIAPASTPAAASGDGNADKVGLLRLSGISGTFQAAEFVAGGTSGHAGYVLQAVPGVGVQVANPTGAFQTGETVTGQTSGATGTAVRDPDLRGTDGTQALLCIFVPNGTNTGYYNIDGTALDIGEINTDLVPVGPKTDGYWVWDPDVSPSIFPYTGPNEGVRCHLLDQQIILGQQVNALCLIGDYERFLGVPNVRPVIVLPHWVLKIKVVKGSTNTTTLSVALDAIGGRRETKP